MKLPARIAATICKLALITAIIPALLACSNDTVESRTATVDMRQLQSQLGYTTGGSDTALSSPANSEATSVALSVAIGAMAVESRTLAEGPYTTRTPITDVESQLEADIRDSANFIVLRDLPTAEDTIEIEMPLAGSKKYQIVAAALRTQPQNVGQLEEPEHQDSVIYIGFDGRFLNTSSDGDVFELDGGGNLSGDPVTSINIELIRACLVEPQDPPKGCAQYNTDGSAVISSAVEIVGVFINDDLATNLLGVVGGHTLVVRSGSSGGCTSAAVTCDPIVARGLLGQILTAQGSGTVSNIQVHVTHKLASNETPVCADSTTTIAALTDSCDVKVFFTPL